MDNYLKVVHLISKHKLLILTITVSILILAVVKLPFLSASYGHDQACYMYMGREISHGAVPFRDFWDHKTPGLPYLNAIIFTLGGKSLETFRLIEFIWTCIVLVLFLYLLKKIWPKNTPAVIFGTLFFTYLLIDPSFSTNDGGDYSEIFMLLPYVLTIILFLLFKIKEKLVLLFLAGITIFLSFFLKQSGAALFLPIGATLFYDELISKKSFRLKILNFVTKFGLVFAGFILPLLIFVIYLFSKNAFSDFLSDTVRFNALYASTTSTGFKIITSINMIYIFIQAYPVTFLFVFIGFIQLFLKKSKYVLLITLWIIADLIAISSSGRFFYHYYIQIFPSLSVVATYGFISLFTALTTVSKNKNNRSLLVLMSPIFFILIFIPYIVTPAMNYINKFRESKSLVQQKNWRNHSLELVSYVKRYTKPGDYIYVWDSAQVYIYLVTETKSSSRFYMGIPLANIHAPEYAALMTFKNMRLELEKHPPKIVLDNEVTLPGLMNTGPVWDYIKTNYKYDKNIKDVNGSTALYLPRK
jgi:hypothetical protein